MDTIQEMKRLGQALKTNVEDYVALLQDREVTASLLEVANTNLQGLYRQWVHGYDTGIRAHPADHWPFLLQRAHFYLQSAQTLQGKLTAVYSGRLQGFFDGLIDDGGLFAHERHKHNQEMERLNAMSYNERLYGDTIRRFVPDIGYDDLKWLSNRAAKIYKEFEVKYAFVGGFRVQRFGVPGHVSVARYADAHPTTPGRYGIERLVANEHTNNAFQIAFVVSD